MRKYFLKLIERISRKDIKVEIKGGRYKPGRRKGIILGNGRVVYVLGEKDLIVEKGVKEIILKELKEDYFPKMVKGYIKKRGTIDAIRSIRKEFEGVDYIIKTDINDHFGSIELRGLVKELKEVFGKGKFIELIWKILRGGEGNRRKKRKRGLLPGGVLSPLFSNIHMRKTDIRLEKIKDIKIIRYGDDILIGLKGNKEKGEEILKKIKGILKENGLGLNNEKTKIVKGKEGVQYLGLNIKINDNGKVIVNGDIKRIMIKLRKQRFVTKEGKGRVKHELLRKSVEKIKKIYGRRYRRSIGYYKICDNYFGLKRQVTKVLKESERKTKRRRKKKKGN